MADAKMIAEVMAFANSLEGRESMSKRLMRPADPNAPDPDAPKILPDFSQDYKSLAKGFERVETDIKNWLNGDFFKPDWEVYLAGLVTAQEKAGVNQTQPVFDSKLFSTLLERIEVGEYDGTARYSRSRPSKTKWEDLDHLAFLLFCVRRENRICRSGILYHKRWPKTEEYWAVWQAIKLMNRITNVARAKDEAPTGIKRKRSDGETP